VENLGAPEVVNSMHASTKNVFSPQLNRCLRLKKADWRCINVLQTAH